MDRILPHLVGLDAQKIHEVLRRELQQAFDECLADFEKRTGAALNVETSLDRQNVVPFSPKKIAAAGGR